MRSFLLLVAASSLLCGCIVVPIPTPEMGTPLIAAEVIKEVQAGVGSLTRDQVVTMFGEPQESYADGQIVLYEWDIAQGIYILWVAQYGAVGPGESEHRIILKYSEEGVLERLKHLDSVLDRDKSANKLIKAWVAEIGGWPEDYPVLWDERGRYKDINHVTLNPGGSGPAVIGSTTLQEFVTILGNPSRMLQDEHALLYESSEVKYFEPVLGNKFEVLAYDAFKDIVHDNYYALVAVFDEQMVLENMLVAEWWREVGPYSLKVVVADAFSCDSEDILFVRPTRFKKEVEGTKGGVYVAAKDFVGLAAWRRDHYEMIWKHKYSAIDTVSYEQYRYELLWSHKAVRIDIHLHSGESIRLELFERDNEKAVDVAKQFTNLVSAKLEDAL